MKKSTELNDVYKKTFERYELIQERHHLMQEVIDFVDACGSTKDARKKLETVVKTAILKKPGYLKDAGCDGIAYTNMYDTLCIEAGDSGYDESEFEGMTLTELKKAAKGLGVKAKDLKVLDKSGLVELCEKLS